MQTNPAAVGTILAVVGIIASVVALLTSTDALWRLGGVAAIFLCLVFLALTVTSFGDFPLASKVATCAGAALMVAGLLQPTGARWLRETAAARLTGNLIPPPWTGTGNMRLYLGKSDRPNLEFGERPAGEPQIIPMYDSRLILENGPSGVEVSTTIRDREGNVIVQIEKNQWRVAAPPICYDKNFTENALEVKDRRDHVVLQLTLLSDGVRIQAEWHDDFAHGFMVRGNADPNHPWAWELEGPNHVITTLIPPMFKYPSSEYLGEFVEAPSTP